MRQSLCVHLFLYATLRDDLRLKDIRQVRLMGDFRSRRVKCQQNVCLEQVLIIHKRGHIPLVFFFLCARTASSAQRPVAHHFDDTDTHRPWRGSICSESTRAHVENRKGQGLRAHLLAEINMSCLSERGLTTLALPCGLLLSLMRGSRKVTHSKSPEELGVNESCPRLSGSRAGTILPWACRCSEIAVSIGPVVGRTWCG